jgi:prevent-host-death family protein
VPVSIADARNHFSELIRKVETKGVDIEIVRRGKTVAVLVNAEEYDRIRKIRAYRQIVEISRRIPKDSMTVTELIHAAREEVERRHDR